MTYPKRLIEVDLPIKRISEHSRREKSIRHGHISTLHIWWARRPLAACRAVLCAALWPDPADPLCPPDFREAAKAQMLAFADKTLNAQYKLTESMSAYTGGRMIALAKRDPELDLNNLQHLSVLRYALLDFIADFANWDNSTNLHYLETARALTQAAHEALGGAPGTRPLVVDPFAGGGAIPLEALRVGADAFASDLNPVAVLLNKVVLEYIPRYGQELADEVRKWGAWIKEQAEQELAEFYPKDEDGATPIAYLWARTITCEGPGCGCEVPLMRSFWLAKKKGRNIALKMIPNPAQKRVDFEIVENPKAKDIGDGTVKRGDATCPCCGYTTPVERVRAQLKARRGGADDARLLAVVTTRDDETGRFYRLPTQRDLNAVQAAAEELERRKAAHTGDLSLTPDEPTPLGGGSGAGRAFSQRNYGMNKFEDLFTPRQLLTITTFVKLARQAGVELSKEHDSQLSVAVQTCLAFIVDRFAERGNSLATWQNTAHKVRGVFARQAISMVWDFCETSPFSDASGDWAGSIEWVAEVVDANKINSHPGQAYQASAYSQLLPDDSATTFFSDPPYYDAVPYSDLSDFFVVWLKRTLKSEHRDLFDGDLAPKDDECIVDEVKGKDKAYFEDGMFKAMSEGRRILSPSGIGTIVFAHKSTAGWEAQLQAMVEAGWTVTGSWPIDTERAGRVRALDSAALASSIHLVCRPRQNPDGSLKQDVGDWRDVLAELPRRIREWLPRLEQEGVVGADAIFACLGPAMEIYSRYARVEKANGDPVPLRDYLEEVWAAVSREALTMIFAGADTTGFEADARLTAMWLWTLNAGANGNGTNGSAVVSDDEDDEELAAKPIASAAGFGLEYDAARKIAQGIGAHLEKLDHLAEVKGNKARLLPVAERAIYLFGKDAGRVPTTPRRSVQQLSLFELLDEAEAEQWRFDTDENKTRAGQTTLDQLHQAMILHATGRTDALKRFLVDDGIGADTRFWRLADSLLRLYPKNTEEYRWLDGLLARKKGLGF